ncbi:hypothetical protein AB2B41_09765 [Marimonas sp. MJW-29]|uniref:Uncharacterized protein n=1 Tax=Sulfitobacter sediminis TaxID=3234186 RepID=A0ABV3RMI1_9RHOB
MFNTEDLKKQAANLERRFETARPQERLNLRPAVHRVIRTMVSHDQPVPQRLRQISRRLDDEAYDDMFENMPV